MKAFTCSTSLGEIAVRESTGNGRPILLLHGNSLGSESYLPQLTGEPGLRYRLVALDLPGHGDSPRPARPKAAYSVSGYQRIVREAASGLGLKDPVVVGHSMGGHVALQAIAGGMSISGLLVFGTPPLGSPPNLDAAFHLDLIGDAFRATLSDSDIERMVRAWMPEGTPPPPYYARSVRATDPAARELIGVSLGGNGYADERMVLLSLRCRAAVVLGQRDRIVNADYVRGLSIDNLWRGGPQFLPGAGHCPQFDTPEAFNSLLAEFLADLP
jgi:pimeloyl-ACP methyl ester carboxylesterase